MVTQFHMTGWPEHGRPASTGSVVEMLDMITKAQMSSGNRSITVLCKSVSVLERERVWSHLSPLLPYSDGVGRSGTFICLHSQLERLKTEGVVDFFQAVKSARTQRAGLVPDAVCRTSLHPSLPHDHSFSPYLAPSFLFSFPPSQDQYAYCHEVLADFVNSYDNYANFKDVV